MLLYFGGRQRYYGGNRNPLLVAVSLVATLGFLGVAGVLFFSAAPNNTPEQVNDELNLDTVEVLVPLERIEAGVQLEPTMFRRESRPSVAVAPNAVRTFEQIKGAYAASFITSGEPVPMELLTLKKPVNSVTAGIPDGYRAVTVSVDLTTSVEGWARGGAKVDVVWTSIVRGKPAVTVIVQNAKVLTAARSAQGDGVNPDSPVPTSITLLVSAEDAQKIQLAQNSGNLSLQLKGDEDDVDTAAGTTITIDSVIGTTEAGPSKYAASEGTLKIDGREFRIVNGKLIPVDE